MDTRSPCQRSLKVKATVNTFAKETVSKGEMKTPALLLGQPTRPGMTLEISRLPQPGPGMVAEGGCEYHDSSQNRRLEAQGILEGGLLHFTIGETEAQGGAGTHYYKGRNQSQMLPKPRLVLLPPQLPTP